MPPYDHHREAERRAFSVGHAGANDDRVGPCLWP